jgi:membrane protein
VRLLLEAARKFDRDKGFFLAGALAFSVLLSVIPLCLLLLSLLGTWFSLDADMADNVSRYLQNLAPAVGPQVAQVFLGIVGDRRIAGVVGLAALAWTATMVFGWLRISLNAVFGVARARGTLRGLAVDLLMIVLAATIMLARLSVSSWLGLLQRFGEGRGRPVGALAAFALSYPVPILFTVLMCFMLYTVAPNRKMPVLPALAAAVVSTLLWEFAKVLFGWYVQHLARYSVVYGSLSTAAIFVLWIQYSAAVFLYGAEIACLLEGSPERGAVCDNPPT